MTAKTNLCAAIYARVSTGEQNTQLQFDEARRLVAARGWTLAKTFEDVGISGSKDKRPQLDALLTTARRRQIDVVVVWRADRLFRSLHHMVAALSEFDTLGVDFVSCTEPFDTSTPTGRLMLHICAAFGQFERDVIIERTKAGMQAAKRRGTKIGRPKKRLDLDAARDMLEGGVSVATVAKAFGVGYATMHRALYPKGSSAGAPEAA